ncbi:ComEC/Rec2 family competence protein [Rhizobium leguminosarum]|uniref:hypothetical protein n=1 Tax=Rhizobium leguminosarum TaxID=384 RepID=UPI001615E406|nr:hypothetical protein [Rhizobium leguminosarum]MBB4341384.1 hypothetical protein [Rhizobium leguminosarum]MBB6294008.1 hypothetical protein [Rhizobium leguminosarum]
MWVRIIGSAPGESLVLVFSCGSIITIDCCKTADENHTINAIDELSLDFGNVIFNVITHFHDDHIKGVSELVAKCPNSKIVIPDAWTADVFKRFVASVSDDTTLNRFSVTREIEKIFDILKGAKHRLFAASELTQLYPPPAHPHSTGETLTVLTPTAVRKASFLSRLANDIDADVADAYAFCENNKNSTSICCVLRQGNSYMLLGGDIENTAPDCDLSSIHKSHLSNVARYDLVKLPHHGSNTSFCTELRNLIDDTHTVVAITPYPRGHKRLPSSETLTYLTGAQNTYVLAGKKIGRSRADRMTKRNFIIDKVPTFRPGTLDFSGGDVDLIDCQTLEGFLSEA